MRNTMTGKVKNHLQSAPSHYSLLPDRLRKLRQDSGYTQRFVAQRLNISSQAYGYYESGQRRFSSSMMAVLANLYHLNILELIELELADTHPNLLNSLRRDILQRRKLSVRFPPEPGHIWEQLTLREYQVLNYYRSLPANVRNDIEDMVAQKDRNRRHTVQARK